MINSRRKVDLVELRLAQESAFSQSARLIYTPVPVGVNNQAMIRLFVLSVYFLRTLFHSGSDCTVINVAAYHYAK